MALTVYLATSLLFFPDGVNREFVRNSFFFTVPITAALAIVLSAFYGFRAILRRCLGETGPTLSARDLVLVLLPLTPVVQYTLNNMTIMKGLEPWVIVLGFLVCISILMFIVPLALKRISSVRSVMLMGMAFSFLITNMATMSRQFSWHESGPMTIQLLLFVSIWLGSWLLYRYKLQNILHVILVAYFLMNSIVQLQLRHASVDEKSPNMFGQVVRRLTDSRKPVMRPNIYLLIYDAYAPTQTMFAYGIDNRPQQDYLEAKGFKIYPHVYSTGATTLTSMNAVLCVSAGLPPDDRIGVSGDGEVQRFLKKLGYQTYGLFSIDYFFRGRAPTYDFFFPPSRSSLGLFITAILEGEFRFDIGFDDLSRDDFIAEKKKRFSAYSKRPKFTYMHTNLPGHSQNSGSCMPNEAELYAERVVRANLEMKDDIETITRQDSGAIVVIAGDHGPYLTKNCTYLGDMYDKSEVSRVDIQDRFGTFLAIKWPTSSFGHYDSIQVLQDIFPSIFAYIFADTSYLSSRISAVTEDTSATSGVVVSNSIISGGVNDGDSLFTGDSYEELRPARGYLTEENLRVAKTVIFGRKSTTRFLKSGWSYAESDANDRNMTFNWALGDSALLALVLPKSRVRLTANVRSLFYGKKQSVTVLVDGKEVGNWINSDPGNWEQHSVVIEENPDRPHISTIEFLFSRHRAPVGNENRQLSLLFRSVTLEEL